VTRDEAPFRILSISGGGFMGLFSAALIGHLEERFGPVGKSFDLIAGTSVGGVIAIGLAAGVPAASIAAGFRTEGARIFSDRPAPVGGVSAARDAMRYLRRPKYDGVHLRRVVEGFSVGHARLGAIPTPVMVSATRLRDGEPVLFSQTSHGDLDPVEIAVAAAAAPMMFPAVRVSGAFHADGAIHSNVPDLLALSHARAVFGVPLERIRMLSIGTVNAGVRLPEPVSGEMGVMGWIQGQRLIRTVIASQDRAAVSIARSLLGDAHLRADLEPTLEERDEIWLDVATRSAIETLDALAARRWKRGDIAMFLEGRDREGRDDGIPSRGALLLGGIQDDKRIDA
jgi:uncharacterized protein